MTFIHENKVNKLAGCNLLHDILNPLIHTKMWISITLLYYKYVLIHKRLNQSLNNFESYWIMDVVPQL